jgi:hypothetical protein
MLYYLYLRTLLSGENLSLKDFNINVALQLLVLYVNLLTTKIFAALQLSPSGRAAVIFVEIMAKQHTKHQRGDNIKKVS